MKKRLIYMVAATLLIVVSSPFAFAAAEAAKAATVDYTKAIIGACSLAVAGVAIAFGTIGTALGMGNGLNGAKNAVGSNPEAQGKILLTMMVGLAMIESLAIYALVISLIVLYANPISKAFGIG